MTRVLTTPRRRQAALSQFLGSPSAANAALARVVAVLTTVTYRSRAEKVITP